MNQYLEIVFTGSNMQSKLKCAIQFKWLTMQAFEYNLNKE